MTREDESDSSADVLFECRFLTMMLTDSPCGMPFVEITAFGIRNYINKKLHLHPERSMSLNEYMVLLVTSNYVYNSMQFVFLVISKTISTNEPAHLPFIVNNR